MKRLFTSSSILIGLALIAFSMFPGCTSQSSGYRTSSVAQAAAVAAGVALCTLGQDAPVSSTYSVDLTDTPETVPEHLLDEDFRYNIQHSKAPGDTSVETVPPHLLEN